MVLDGAEQWSIQRGCQRSCEEADQSFLTRSFSSPQQSELLRVGPALKAM
jgi:hypothetical protein